ncbi:mitogen-activated kinase maf1 protein [Rutstroemia sp. NJR-2017a BVV2]|nr:mitogen-activated kinase maf1 protein [Rutstroemia sp. NJR-2017a BVV2]
MKFLPLRDFDNVTSALNFNTPDCHVIGGCDLYTTKAAGSDKKLYRNIENSLESQYASLLKLSASVSPPRDSAEPIVNLSRSSPFGPLSQVSSRRTFAYLIATLNASHPDYDFSHILRPADFRKERNLRSVMNSIDSTLYSLRPSNGMTMQGPSQAAYATTGSAAPSSQAWGPQMWTMIDKEMSLKDCTVYCWAPPDEPFDGDEGAIWSLNYFFFNKERKRVAYLYVRAVPVMSHSPRQAKAMAKRTATYYDTGANKRARFWLGDRANDITDDSDDVEMWDKDDEVDVDEDFSDTYDDEADDESDEQSFKAPIRGVSEDIAASMDMDY